jgi:hypothetical protein
VRIYLNTQRTGAKFSIRAEDVEYLLQAAAQATLIHLDHGRLEIGLTAAKIAAQFLPATAPDAVRTAVQTMNDRVLGMTSARVVCRWLLNNFGHAPPGPPNNRLPLTTLAGALAATGQDPGGQLVQALTRPVLDCAIIIPSQRSALSVAPAYAARLATTAIEVFPTSPVDGIRIGLEAHYLFAAASNAQHPELRYAFRDYGPNWARVLLAIAAAFEARNNLKMALDVASWAAGAARQLQLMPPFFTPELATLAQKCVQCHGQMLIATGDREAGEQALATAATITASTA